MKKLKLEINEKHIKDPSAGNSVMITPPIGQDYWLVRVHLFEDQYIQAFPKFLTIGIGFVIEEDWNTNLPWTGVAEDILKHIWHNRRYIAIKKKRATRAIEMIQEYLKKVAA